jgi:hypothetical protein
VLAGSIRTLSPAAARLFGLLGSAPGPSIGAAAAAGLTGRHPGAQRAVLRELLDANLLILDPPAAARR